jgi:pyridoxamine 5'-phosphate oxidase
MRETPPLLETSACTDPFAQFGDWFDEALTADLTEPTAMALATADAQGQPSLRMVLLKGYDRSGFVFYSNYRSRKGEELAVNPRAALLWWWDHLYRQVRVEGRVEPLSRTESESYFHSRPRGSQLSALASPQSRVIADRAQLEAEVERLTRRYAGQPVPLPEDWGGYRLHPQVFEFWQGRPDRLHDRLRYWREGDRWGIERLGP